jgi:hypothetical protein
MTDSIAPPPELVQQWAHEWNTLGVRHPDATNTASYVATRAAQWGADQELEACCEWTQGYAECGDSLRAARRPKPPSLKEQALVALNKGCFPSDDEIAAIRRALEALPE